MKEIKLEQAIREFTPEIQPQGLANIVRYWADSITKTEKDREVYPDANF